MKRLIPLFLLLSLIISGCAQQLPADTTPTETDPPETQAPTETNTEPPTEVPTEEPTEPSITKVSTATIGATGDILMHDNVIKSGYDSETDTYNYDEIFQFFSQYAASVDYAVANLEVTLCGNDNGYNYKGYPCFNSPDAIVDALKNAGFDMLLTANNHSYDTRHTGFMRTQSILKDRNMPYIGTRETAEEDNFLVVDVNGIRIGMINYTYNTSQSEEKVALNGISLTADDSQCINSFHYKQLDTFYSRLENQMNAMRQQGAEAFVIFIHWGTEYQTSHNKAQAEIAQQLCNMGFDVIVGNHAHVPQDMELLTSETDENRKTACLYSTGNAVSNIYRGGWIINTEDGMLFQFTFAKYSDGTVLLESADVLPTWVYRHRESGVWHYTILPLDITVEDWKTAMELDSKTQQECKNSYDRTMEIVGEGLADINEWCQGNQTAIESLLGVSSDD